MAGRERDQSDPRGLHPHAGHDEPLAADPVREATRDELSYAPDGWIDRGKKGDVPQPETGGGKEERQEPPRHAVVQIVYEAGLADGGEVSVEQRGPREDLSLRQASGPTHWHVEGLVARVIVSLANHEQGEKEPRYDEPDPQREGPRP